MIEQPLMDQASTADIKPGDVFKVKHPFVFEDYALSWKPGTIAQHEGPNGERSPGVAHGNGFQVLTVVSLHRPGPYPTRVFYTRKWIDPNGGEFGKRDLLCKSVSAFRQIIKGYRWAYGVEPIETKEATQ